VSYIQNANYVLLKVTGKSTAMYKTVSTLSTLTLMALLFLKIIEQNHVLTFDLDFISVKS